MAVGDLTKENIIDRMEVYGSWSISIRTSIRVNEEQADGSKKEMTRTFHRHTLVPFSSSRDSDGKWTHTETDLDKSNDGGAESTEVKAIANAAWSDAVKQEYKTWAEANPIAVGAGI